MLLDVRSVARTALAGCVAASFAVAAALPAFAQYSLSEGTQISAVLATPDIDTKTAQVGDGFTMDIVRPYPNGDANFAGAKLRGHVADVAPGGQGKTPRLRLAFDSIVFPNGDSMPVSAAVTTQSSKSDNTTARKGLGAAIGAAVGSQTIGRVIGGSAGSVVGLLGGAVGGFLFANNNKPNITLAKGTAVNVQTTTDVEVPRPQARENPNEDQAPPSYANPTPPSYANPNPPNS
jgi:hypothetical protein